MNRGKPNWEHLNDELHVLITVEDTDNRARLKMKRATDEIKKLLVPAVSLTKNAGDTYNVGFLRNFKNSFATCLKYILWDLGLFVPNMRISVL